MNLTKRVPYRNKKILQAARGQECTFNGPTCNHDPETVVFCHSDYSEDGKGMRSKADDCFGFFGCHACHEYYGHLHHRTHGINTRDMFHRAMKRTWRILLDMGILK